MHFGTPGTPYPPACPPDSFCKPPTAFPTSKFGVFFEKKKKKRRRRRRRRNQFLQTRPTWGKLQCVRNCETDDPWSRHGRHSLLQSPKGACGDEGFIVSTCTHLSLRPASCSSPYGGVASFQQTCTRRMTSSQSRRSTRLLCPSTTLSKPPDPGVTRCSPGSGPRGHKGGVRYVCFACAQVQATAAFDEHLQYAFRNEPPSQSLVGFEALKVLDWMHDRLRLARGNAESAQRMLWWRGGADWGVGDSRVRVTAEESRNPHPKLEASSATLRHRTALHPTALHDTTRHHTTLHYTPNCFFQGQCESLF